MAHHENIKVVDKFNIVGRGIVFVVDVINDNVNRMRWIKEIPFKRGDTFSNDGATYQITGIEAQANLLNGNILSKVGLKVKEI